jgi:magnesium chelatase family protein
VVARALRRTRYPARLQLVAAMNPCPCGYLGSGFRECRCTPDQVQRYRDRISGPLLDRFDLLVEVSRPGDALFQRAAAKNEESSASLRERVCAARDRQLHRQGITNAELRDESLERFASLSDTNRELLIHAVQRWGLSARAYHRVLRVARTIADLDDRDPMETAHISEALAFRLQDISIQ